MGKEGEHPLPLPNPGYPGQAVGMVRQQCGLAKRETERRRALTEESRISKILGKYFTLTQLPGTPISLAGEMETWALLCLLQRVGWR